MPDILRTRIAPTPSGYLHIGNACNFLLTEVIALTARGSLRLRIDDLDAPRVRQDYVRDIFEILAWLGIQPDAGPKDMREQDQQFSQRLRDAQYDVMLRRLVDTGLVFACACSRKDLQQRNDGGQYTGTCLHMGIPLNRPDVVWRIQTPKESAVASFCDRIAGGQQFRLWDVQRHFIIRRRDGLAAYQLAALCDDVAYGINTIVRGADLLTSTAAQLYLADLLGLESFQTASFYHHPLLLDEYGAKLSKSAGSTSLKALRKAGGSADELRAEAAGWYQLFL